VDGATHTDIAEIIERYYTHGQDKIRLTIEIPQILVNDSFVAFGKNHTTDERATCEVGSYYTRPRVIKQQSQGNRPGRVNVQEVGALQAPRIDPLHAFRSIEEISAFGKRAVHSVTTDCEV